MREDGKIGYVELPGGDLIATKRFYGAAFGWTFTGHGPSYSAFAQGAGRRARRRHRRPCHSGPSRTVN